MASNITGQLLGLISAGSAFMGNARREAAMSEKRYETKEAATKAAEQKQIEAEQKEAEKAAKKEQREIEETAKAENRIAGKEAAKDAREADAELTKQKSKLVQEKTRAEKSKRIGTYGEGGALNKSKKAKIQEIAEADAMYQAQQSQEQHTNQKDVVQQLITEAKNNQQGDKI